MAKPITNETLMTLAEVAEYTRLSESKIRQMIRAGQLVVVRSNGNGGKILTSKENVLKAFGLKGAGNE